MRRLATGMLAAVAALALAGLPAMVDPYLLYLADLTFAYVVVSVGFNILLGFAGQFAFASAAFMAIGAYTLGLLMSRLGVPFLIALPASGATAAVLGALVALPSFRLKTVYLAMATMAFAELVQWVLVQWKEVTLGTDGVNVPYPAIGPLQIHSDAGVYYVILAVTVLCVLAARQIVYSRVGRSFIAIRENEIVARCCGINVTATKAIAFGISAFFAGIGGALFALSLRYIVPDGFGMFQLTTHFAMVLIGGLGSLVGSILGAALLTALPELLRDAQAYQEIIYGGLLIGFIIFLPKGIAGLLHRAGLLQREILVRGWRRFAETRKPGVTASAAGAPRTGAGAEAVPIGAPAALGEGPGR